MNQVNASNPAYMFKAYYRQLSMPSPAEVTPTPTLQPDPATRPCNPQPPNRQPCSPTLLPPR